MICLNTLCDRNDRNQCTNKDDVKIGMAGECMKCVQIMYDKHDKKI